MGAISAGNLTLLRADNHRAEYYASVLNPLALWSARINDGSIAKGDTTIAFDGGSGLDWSAVEVHQTLWVGSSAGAHDVGLLRIRSVSSGDGGVTGTITVDVNGHEFSNNDYLTFKHNYEVWPIFPYIDPVTFDFFKDRDVTYTDENTQPPPVVIAGSHQVGFMSGGSLVFNVDASASYTTANAATVASYGLSVYPSTGVTVAFNTGTGTGTVTVTSTTQSYYWAKFTVTDSNGKTQASYRCLFAHEDDKSSAIYPRTDFSFNQIDGAWERGGWFAQLTVSDDASLSEWPDRSLCVLWQRSWYGSTQTEITVDADGAVITAGYIKKDILGTNRKTGYQTTVIDVHTPEERMKQTFEFSISLAAHQSPSKWYEYESWLTIGRACHHVLRWHSTVMETVDVFGLLSDTTGRGYAEFTGTSLYQVLDGIARDSGGRSHFVCDKAGRLHMVKDIQLLNDSERAALTEVMEIDEADVGGEIRLPRNQTPQVAFVHVAGLVYSGGFDADGYPDITGFCADAPSQMPATLGSGVISLDSETITGQTQCNEIAGRVYSRESYIYNDFPCSFAGNYLGVLDVHLDEWWKFNMGSTQNVRDIVVTDMLLACRKIRATPNVKTGHLEINVSFEPEAPSFTGVPGNCLDEMPEIGGSEPLVTDDGPGAIITGSSVYYRKSGSSSWDLRSAENVSDLIQDPYWRATQASVNSSDAIIWRTGVGYVKRSTDAGLTWSTVTPGTDPPNDAGDGPAPTVAVVDFKMISASYIDNQRFVVMVNWQNAGGDERCWLAVTSDDGSTWAWQSIYGTTPGTTGHDIGAILEFGATATVECAGAPLNGKYFLTVASDNDGANTVVTASLLERDDEDTLSEVASTTIAPSDGFSGDDNFDDMFVLPISSTEAYIIGERDQSLSARRISRTGIALSYNATQTTEWPFAGASTVLGTQAVALGGGNSYVVVRVDGDLVGMEVAGGATGQMIIGSVNTIRAETGTHQYSPQGLVVIDSDHVLITYLRMGKSGADDWAICAAIITRTVFAVGAESTIETTGAGGQQFSQAPSQRRLVELESGRAVGSYTRAVSGTVTGMRNFGFVLEYSASSISAVGTPVRIDQGVLVGNLVNVNFVACVDKINVTDVEFCFSATTTNLRRSATVSGTVITMVGNHENFGFGEFDDLNGTGGAWYYTGLSGYFFHSTLDDSGVLRNSAVLVSPPRAATSDYDCRGLGVLMSRYGGGYLYLTFWRTGRLYVRKYSVPALTPYGEQDLGAATISQVNSETYIAYPALSWTTDANVYLFGRMSSPVGLSGVKHIVVALDFGFDWATLENSWGTGICGSLHDIYGTVAAIRNTGSNAKLYIGDTDSIVVRSTLPLNSGVAPHGFTFHFGDLSFIACSDAAKAIMVVGSAFPYVTWSDITADHGVSRGVNAVEIL